MHSTWSVSPGLPAGPVGEVQWLAAAVPFASKQANQAAQPRLAAWRFCPDRFGTYLADCDAQRGEEPAALSDSTAKEFATDLRARVSSGRPVRGVFIAITTAGGSGATGLQTRDLEGRCHALDRDDDELPLIINALRRVIRWAVDSPRASLDAILARTRSTTGGRHAVGRVRPACR